MEEVGSGYRTKIYSRVNGKGGFQLALEDRFDTAFIAALADREKQIQQFYRPVIGIHKWFARRPGTLFRGLLLAEFVDRPLAEAFFQGHRLPDKVIADPFMGGGTPLIEANRLGMSVIGADINPMAYWIVRQALARVNLVTLKQEAAAVASRVDNEIHDLYQTRCTVCGNEAIVKYFLWVKESRCASCGTLNDLFPGHLVATADRHTAYVWHCPHCDQLVETPGLLSPGDACPHCGKTLVAEGRARQGRYSCSACGAENHYPDPSTPPQHRLFAIEYYCPHCHKEHKGRYFKAPDPEDLIKVAEASRRLDAFGSGLIPSDEIPDGDETNRLHRWGYRHYRELFNDRQLLGLQLLEREIDRVEDQEVRFALATIFSDMLRYQNMLCRYDTRALKCQDIFSVHGFPVGLIQCENNLLGISGVGSGGFRHFVEKYLKAKAYCARPYETIRTGRSNRQVKTAGERIEAHFAARPEKLEPSQAFLTACDSSSLELPPASLDGVFTDPPYFDNVQYAELMDFCYVWLRRLLADQVPEFQSDSTRNARELTGNGTLGRGIGEFTEGLSLVFQKMTAALKPEAPFVFTYHHNDREAYLPIIVAILDSGLTCTATLASPAEMTASLHINGTNSSTMDTVFVCRKSQSHTQQAFPASLLADVRAIEEAGVHVSPGGIACLALGHLSRLAVRKLASSWDKRIPVDERLQKARQALDELTAQYPLKDLAKAVA